MNPQPVSSALLAAVPLADHEWVGLTIGALWLALILIMLAAAVKLAKEFRRNGFRVLGIFAGHEADDAQDTHASLTKFRELHARGGLSDEEYRTIKTKLASQLGSDSSLAADAELPTDPTSPTPGPTFLPADGSQADALPATEAPAADAAGAAVDETTSDLSDERS